MRFGGLAAFGIILAMITGGVAGVTALVVFVAKVVWGH